MTTRNHRTPLSIWIIVTLTSVVMLPQVGTLFTNPNRRSLYGVVMILGVPLYHAIALARLSRWPILLNLGAASVVLISSAGVFRAHYPWMTTAFMFAPLGFGLVVYLACTLPHWPKMNWAPFGRSYQPPEDEAKLAA
jgi:hypothetical protein